MKTLLSRQDLAERWGLAVKTIEKYENDGVIQRVKGIPAPRYSIESIQKLEGMEELNPLSPEEIMESNETLKEELNSNEIKTPNISEDNLGFNLFKKFTKELGSKYEKYLDITM